MQDRKKTFEQIKAIAWFILILSLFCWLVFVVMGPAKQIDSEGIARYDAFYARAIKGKITGVDAGRGTKIKVDNAAYIQLPGRTCTSCKTEFSFETGENIGDSLIKKPNSDAFLLKTPNGDTLTFKIVR